ncbi:hypothetical protein Tco_1107680 [Tanacetum coccineum]
MRSIRKRSGRRLKMKATKKYKRQKTNSDLEEEEQLRAYIKIVLDEEEEIDYEVLGMRYPTVNWESAFYHTDIYGVPHDYYRVFSDISKVHILALEEDGLKITCFIERKEGYIHFKGTLERMMDAPCYSNEALAIHNYSEQMETGEDCWVLEDFTTYCWFNIGAASKDLVLLRKIEENRLRIKNGSSKNTYSKLSGRGLSSRSVGVSDSDSEFSSAVIAMNLSNSAKSFSSRMVPLMELKILLPSLRRESKYSSKISSMTSILKHVSSFDVKKRSSQDKGNFTVFFHFENNEIDSEGEFTNFNEQIFSYSNRILELLSKIAQQKAPDRTAATLLALPWWKCLTCLRSQSPEHQRKSHALALICTDTTETGTKRTDHPTLEDMLRDLRDRLWEWSGKDTYVIEIFS